MCSTKQFLVGSNFLTGFGWTKIVFNCSSGFCFILAVTLFVGFIVVSAVVLAVVSAEVLAAVLLCFVILSEEVLRFSEVLFEYTTSCKYSLVVDLQFAIRNRYQTENTAMVHNNIRESVDALMIRSQVMMNVK